MEHYRVAIIGLGGMGVHHAEAVQAEENCTLVGGAEIDAERRRAWGERFGVVALGDDYEKLLDEVAPDIALIATQAPQHHGPAIAAARLRGRRSLGAGGASKAGSTGRQPIRPGASEPAATASW